MTDTNDNKNPPPSSPTPTPALRRPRNNSFVWMLLILGLVFLAIMYNAERGKISDISYGFFRSQLIESQNIERVTQQGLQLTGEFKTPPADPNAKPGTNTKLEKKFSVELPPSTMATSELTDELYKQLGRNYIVTEPPDNTFVLFALYALLTLGLFFGLWFMFRKARDSIFTGGVMGGFSKSGARRYEAGDKRDHVRRRGRTGRREERSWPKSSSSSKNPEKFQRFGARVPKGILLMGPPGTGQDAPRPGRGGRGRRSVLLDQRLRIHPDVRRRRRGPRPRSVRHRQGDRPVDHLHRRDRRRRPASRGGRRRRTRRTRANAQSNPQRDGRLRADRHRDRDGRDQSPRRARSGAASPRPLRPARDGRSPDFKGPSGDLQSAFARACRSTPTSISNGSLSATVGLTGADIRNLVNEAALWASRNGKDSVDRTISSTPATKLLMGSKRDEVLSAKEKSMTAYHEAGHTLLAWLLPNADRVHKVSIIPRGRAVGVTQLMPEEDRVSICESELPRAAGFPLGGRAAEKLVFNELNAGAEDDLNRATQIARRMVTHWGMSERLGPVAFRDSEDHPFFGKEMAEPRRYSEHTAQLIDEEISRLVERSRRHARSRCSNAIATSSTRLAKALEAVRNARRKGHRSDSSARRRTA